VKPEFCLIWLLSAALLSELLDTVRRENLLFMERLQSSEAQGLLNAMVQRSK
jgi:hypothetical protein